MDKEDVVNTYNGILLSHEKICMNSHMQVKKHQLELDREQQTGSKLGKEYIHTVQLI